jgi:hypothetical protein
MVPELSQLLGMAQLLALQVEEPLELLTLLGSSMTLFLLSVWVLTLTALLVTQRQSNDSLSVRDF